MKVIQITDTHLFANDEHDIFGVKSNITFKKVIVKFINNCWIENQIRPFAVGRRNWLFTGTPESANKAALLYSLIQTCRMNGIQARAYLEYVLNQAQAMRRGDVSPISLLPQFIDKSIF